MINIKEQAVISGFADEYSPIFDEQLAALNRLGVSHIELRGIGIINAKEVYGWSSVKPEAGLDLIVKLEFWDEDKFYDRLGIDTEYEEIMGVKVPCITIPVRPGRNLAVIIELATLNNRQKKMGNNAAQMLEEAMGQMYGA